MKHLSLFFALAPASLAQDLEYQENPGVLGPDAPRLGEWIADVEFTDAHGEASSLARVMGEKGLVVALRDPECPLSKKYSPLLGRLEDEARAAGFGFLFALVGDGETAGRDIEAYDFDAPYAVDESGVLARALAATTTTEVFVLDRARTLVYRGMIDDQYGLGFAKPAVGRAHLREVLAELGSGKAVEPYGTVAHGCLLELDEVAEPAERVVTYHEVVSRIVQNRCESCHRDGGVAPFPLSTFEQVNKKKRMMKWAVKSGSMPPWFAAEGSGPWANDCSLSPDEKDDLLTWIASGAPEGDPAHAPLPREYAPGWTIGEPDYVIAMEESFTVPAEGVVDYQYFYAKTDFPEDRWVRAVELRPSAPEVTHHALVLLGDADEKPRPMSMDGTEGFYAVNVPGQPGTVFPEGHGKLLPAGAWLKFQMHYTPNGTEQVDRTEMGFIFADGPVEHEIETSSAYNDSFSIPPGAFNYEVAGEMEFEQDARVLSLFPHTHVRGIAFLYELTYPDGRTEPLLEIPAYDFNWQLYYELAEPVEVPKGTTLRATAWYDNTPDNPANPDASAYVGFGDQTFNEMMIGYVNWTAAN